MNHRREFLTTAGGIAAGALAGCSSSPGSKTTTTRPPSPSISVSDSRTGDKYLVDVGVSGIHGQTVVIESDSGQKRTVNTNGKYPVGPVGRGTKITVVSKSGDYSQLLVTHVVAKGATKTTVTTTSTPKRHPVFLEGVGGSTLPDKSVKGAYQRTFKQTANGTQTVFTTAVPKALYQYYEARPRVPNFGVYVSDFFDDPSIKNMTKALRDYGDKHGLSPSQVVNNAVAIVQYMKYTKDEVSTGYNEYPKFPMETLKDRGGDCEDTSILLASMLDELNFGTVLLKMESAHHMAVGVKGDPSMGGTYFEKAGTRYYYVETTGKGWQVGQMPPSIRKQNPKAKLVSIDDTPVLAFQWNTTVNPEGGVDVAVRTYNVGDGVARNAAVTVEVENKSKNVVAHAHTALPSIERDKATKTLLHLNPPADEPLRVRVGALLNGNVQDVATSDYHAPKN